VGDSVQVVSGDTTPPTVASTSPTNGANGVAIGSNITATFSEAMAAATISTSSFTLAVTGGASVSGSVSYNAATLTATFDPTADLAYSTGYTATLTTAVTDLVGNHLAIAYSWSFTTAAAPAPPVGGGGAGAPTPPSTIDTGFFTGQWTSHPTSASGVIQETITGVSPDGKITITIPAGTKALDKDGKPLQQMKTAVLENPPPPPTNSQVIGAAYDFQGQGATFDPPITLTFKYDPNDIHPNVNEVDLVVAWWDATIARWVELESVVDIENNIVTAKVKHFTTFAILGRVVIKPAAFTLGSVNISPAEVAVGETVNIRISVANSGGQSGIYKVTLKINGMVEGSREVTVAAGQSEEVSFTISKDVAGSYSVDVNGVIRSFVVVPRPATFALGSLSISPTEAIVGDKVNISIPVTNAGGQSGTYDVALKIDGVTEDARTVTLEPGATEQVSFIVSRDSSVTYSVAVNDITGSLLVKEKPAVVEPTPTEEPPAAPTPVPPNWWLVNAVIAAGLVAAALVVLFIRNRQRRGE